MHLVSHVEGPLRRDIKRDVLNEINALPTLLEYSPFYSGVEGEIIKKTKDLVDISLLYTYNIYLFIYLFIYFYFIL